MADSLNESDRKYLQQAILNPDPVFTAVELAEDVGVTQQAAHSKLTNLEDRGLVRSKEVGSRARVWWVTDEGRRAYDDSG